MHKKFGDTLVEVALAIGIFSLVAIVIVSVISASTSGAQNALEVTITREDLDSQAEALRFIHDSYVSGSQSKDTTQNNYAELWNAIAEKAIKREEDVISSAKLEEYLKFNPSSCSELYDTNGLDAEKTGKDDGKTNKPFIINIRQLGNPEGNTNKILISNGDTNSAGNPIFRTATTFPRIVYNKQVVLNDSGDKEIAEDLDSQARADDQDTIYSVEGMYIIAVKGEASQVVSGSDHTAKPQSAHYDFYIRSCWMPPGAERASTISTVVRLYDPAVICYESDPKKCPN